MNIQTHPTRPRGRRGFTITELLVAIAIIVVLAAISFSVVAKSRKKANSVSCMQNLRDWSAVFAQASADYSNRLPAPKNWAAIGNSNWDPTRDTGRAPFVNYWADNDDQRFRIQLEKRDCPCLDRGFTPGGNTAPTYLLNRLLIDANAKSSPSAADRFFISLGQVRRASNKVLFIDGKDTGNQFDLRGVADVNNLIEPAAEAHGGSVNAVFADLSVRPIKPGELRNNWEEHTQRQRR